MSNFIVDEGIATDTTTGLMWLRFALGQEWKNGTVEGNPTEVDWETAFESLRKFNDEGGYAGYADWQLPTIDQLKTLIDTVKGKEGNYIDADVFPTHGASFWSSSPYPHVTQFKDAAWLVNFCKDYGRGYNEDDYDPKKFNNAVRFGRNEK